MMQVTAPTPERSTGTRGLIALTVICLLVLIPVTVMALWQYGVGGVFASIVQSRASLQIYLDLFILCVFAIVWMRRDSRETGRRFWPWAILTLAAGSFGPLLYLLVGAVRDTRRS
ncbi:MAG: DUF2834 domain-containing protein [Coriobacteriia bacterium]|nr:DUF2834 domain-containing protein [Coriobacteriia bacterium]